MWTKRNKGIGKLMATAANRTKSVNFQIIDYSGVLIERTSRYYNPSSIVEWKKTIRTKRILCSQHLITVIYKWRWIEKSHFNCSFTFNATMLFFFGCARYHLLYDDTNYNGDIFGKGKLVFVCNGNNFEHHLLFDSPLQT